MRWSFAAPRIGTPQILSGGKYQCGPAPYSFVKNNAGGQYDVDFISSAVSAPVQYFSVNGGNTNLIETVYGCLGSACPVINLA